MKTSSLSIQSYIHTVFVNVIPASPINFLVLFKGICKHKKRKNKLTQYPKAFHMEMREGQWSKTYHAADGDVQIICENQYDVWLGVGFGRHGQAVQQQSDPNKSEM